MTSHFGLLDRPAHGFYGESFNQVLITFALARTVNAVISVAQDSDFEFHPVGIGMTVGIGEALDPVNDMVERFSWIMVLSATSLGVQRVLLEVSDWWPLRVALLVLGTMYLLSIWRAKATAFEPRMQRLFLLLLFLRLSVPLILFLNSFVHGAFLQAEYEEAKLTLEQVDQEIKPFHDAQQEPAHPEERRRLWDTLDEISSVRVAIARWANSSLKPHSSDRGIRAADHRISYSLPLAATLVDTARTRQTIESMNTADP